MEVTDAIAANLPRLESLCPRLRPPVTLAEAICEQDTESIEMQAVHMTETNQGSFHLMENHTKAEVVGFHGVQFD